MSLEGFRAVKTSDERLMKRVVKAKRDVHDPLLQWSANCEENCMDLAIRMGNEPMVELLKQYPSSRYTSSRVAVLCLCVCVCVCVFCVWFAKKHK